MKQLRITTLADDGGLTVEQIPLAQIVGYYYHRPPEEGPEPSALVLYLSDPTVGFPSHFDGSKADEVAKALRLHRPPLAEGFEFGAMVHDDDPR